MITQHQRIATQLKLEKEQLAILIDPDKFNVAKTKEIVKQLPEKTNFIFVGGSTANAQDTTTCVKALQQHCHLPIVLFPGHHCQITTHAQAVLFLSLLSGSNADYLIHQQTASVKAIRHSNLEVIPTAYILIDGGKISSVEKVSQTSAIPQHEVERIVDIALAAKYMGKALIYLEAGSGALHPVSTEIISAVKQACDLPILVGGGLKTPDCLEKAYVAGANLCVVGTAFENQLNL